MKFLKAVSAVAMMGCTQWVLAHPGHDAPLVHLHQGASGAGTWFVAIALVAVISVGVYLRNCGSANDKQGGKLS